MGAFVWWELFKQFGPLSLKGLVVVDQAPTDFRFPDYPNGLITQEMLCEWIYRVQTERNELMREILPMMFAKSPAPIDFAWMYDEMTRAPEVIAASALFDQSTRDYRNIVINYPIPTLVCSGRHSMQPLEGAQLIVDSVQNSQLVIFEESGHSPYFEESEKFNHIVNNFILTL